MSRRGCATIRPDLPAGIEALFRGRFRRIPAMRYQSASEMLDDLSAALAALDAPLRALRASEPLYAIPAAVLLLLARASPFGSTSDPKNATGRVSRRSRKSPGCRARSKPLAAFRLLQEAQKYLPGDPQLGEARRRDLPTRFGAILAAGSFRGNQRLLVARRRLVSAGHHSSRATSESPQAICAGGFRNPGRSVHCRSRDGRYPWVCP